MPRRRPDRTVLTTDCPDCGGRCVMRLHVSDEAIARTETDNGEEPQCRACLKGRAIRQLTYSPDRVLYPMRRAGRRGEGRFERISWDEALDTVAARLRQVRDTRGPQDILFLAGSGSTGKLHGFGRSVLEVLNRFGGCTTTWGSPSAEGARWASAVTYGTAATAHTRDDLLRSRLVIMWAWNPAVVFSGNTSKVYLARCREGGTRIIAVDPQLTDSVAAFADQWIPIRPGTDVAMALAMAHVMIAEGLHDRAFLERYTIGFERFREYVMGADGAPKTPAWAEPITGVPAATIASAAREYATTKPAALIPGYGPGRAAYGEQYHRALAVLACMTGNVGIHGGNSAGFGFLAMSAPTIVANPVEGGRGADLALSLDPAFKSQYRIHESRIWDAMLHGKAGGYPSDCRFLYVVASNCVNQQLNSNLGAEALARPDFIVVHEPWLTATARFADILLPAAGYVEHNELVKPAYPDRYAVFAAKAIEPVGESRSDLEIAAALAHRLGIKDYPERTEDERLREIAALPDIAGMCSYDELKRKGVHKTTGLEPHVAFQAQIEDPEHNPFPTPSGKIEIYSQRVADLGNPNIPPIPHFFAPAEGFGGPLGASYPLQLITVHCGRRANSVFEGLPWLGELYPQALAINSEDARARGIRQGQMVRVFNGRGQMVVPARVTERIMPGVVRLDQGAWFMPDANGIDQGGCPNVLTDDHPSPAGAFPYNTGLVQVEKA